VIVEVDGKLIDANLIMFDTISLQVWEKKDGKMVINISADNIEKIIVEIKKSDKIVK